jgi:pimeloyl-ACP methyl ester carboxylesterase
MATFVLVHGAWHGSWCWKRVRRGLQAQGHDVFTPTLTGVGERSHLLSRQVNLDTHIFDVENLMRWEDLSDVVLCGHSYGGCVIGGVADRVPERIRAVVYLDAFVLESGDNLAQHVPEPQYKQMLEAVQAVGEGWKVPPIPAEVFNVNAADREWVNRQCTMQPLETFEQRLRLSGGAGRIGNVTFILATGFVEGSPFPPFYEKAKARGWKTIALPCGHDVMLDLPEDLTKILVDVSKDQPAVAL